MRFFYLEPEVAGGLGSNTEMDVTVHPPLVKKLHYEFAGWLGDVVLESFPSFIITEVARTRLSNCGMTGAGFDSVELSTSDEFKELQPHCTLPTFYWFRVEGRSGYDDFGIAPDHRLVVSERALNELAALGISHAVVTPFER